MKLSEKTLMFLKNIANINRSINILPGNVIRTMGPDKEIMMRVEIDEQIDKPIRVFELSRLLGVIGMFEDTELTLEDDHVLVQSASGAGKVKYMYAAEEACPKAMTKDITMSDIAIAFTLTAKDFNAIIKASSILGTTDVSIRGGEGELALIAHNKGVKSTDNYRIVLGETEGEFELDFKVEKLKLIPADYEVEISKKRIAHFANADLKLDYWVGLEYTSKFE